MSTTTELNRQEEIRRKCAILQKLHPLWSFQQAWQELQKQASALFEEADVHKLHESMEASLPPGLTLSDAIRRFRELTPDSYYSSSSPYENAPRWNFLG